MKSTKRILIITLAFALILLAPLSVAAAETTKYDPILEVYELIKGQHISNIDDASLTAGAIKGMIETLNDPHSTYFTEAEFRRYVGDLDGDFAGIGIYISKKGDYIEVQSTVANSPAERAGLMTGDLLISVDGTDLKGASTEEASSLIRGKAGTTISLTIERAGKQQTYRITREQIHIPAVTSELLANKIGYLQINLFSSNVDQEIASELTKLKNLGMTSLIIDLRDNPGGFLNSVINATKLFIQEGPIVYIRDKYSRESVESISNGTNWTMPTVVLINSGSASASEIFASALQDYKKATVIGVKSYGKGTVQQFMPLNSGGYLKLTINEYFSSLHNKVNGVGVSPDIVVEDAAKQLDYAKLYLAEKGGLRSFVPTKGTAWINTNNQDYVALRDISKFFGGSVYWDSVKKAVTLKIGSERVEFSQKDGGLVVVKGVSYLPVSELNKKVSSLIAVKQDNIIRIYGK